MKKFSTRVVIRTGETELLSLLESLGLEGGRFLPCRLIGVDGPYVHVEVAGTGDLKLRGEFLIPHHSVVGILTSTSNKILGFGQGA
jgi:hypothetical protein